MNSVMSCMLNRRSTRGYTSQKVDESIIKQLITAASWSPSGNNMQPWKFSVIMTDTELIEKISSLTIYNHWVKTAPCLIAVFLDKQYLTDKVPSIYLKHVQAIGASIQNMLLAAQELGLGTCWIGEILKNEDKVKELLHISDELQLMAVISVGYPAKINLNAKRRDISESIINWL